MVWPDGSAAEAAPAEADGATVVTSVVSTSAEAARAIVRRRMGAEEDMMISIWGFVAGDARGWGGV